MTDPVDLEVPLAGGNLATVVRKGATVRRKAGAWTPTVHALLAHLEARGFDAAPRALGVDDRGREILTYLPGETVGDARPWPAWVWSETTLAGVGRLLRRYHDAVRDFVPPADAQWRLAGAGTPGPGEVVCHNDVAPYNFVLSPDGSLGLIDWDVSGPGAPADDVAFAACGFASMNDDATCRSLGWRTPPDRARRLRTLVDAYGLDDRAGFVDRMASRLRRSIDRITAAASGGDPAFQGLIDRGGLEPVEGALRTIRACRLELEAHLLA